MNSFFNWSGGKDSALALYHSLKSGKFDIRYLLTTINQQYGRISMHGVREILLEQQAESIGIPLMKVPLPEFPSMEDYEAELSKSLVYLQKQGIDQAIFGDIFLEDLKEYRVNQLKKIQVNAHFPLWKRNTSELVKEFIGLGFKTVIVCVDEKQLDGSFAGRILDEDFLKDLPKNVDPCGENGEFHSFVFEGPIFKNPIKYHLGELTYKKYDKDDPHIKTGFWFKDILPV